MSGPMDGHHVASFTVTENNLEDIPRVHIFSEGNGNEVRTEEPSTFGLLRFAWTYFDCKII